MSRSDHDPLGEARDILAQPAYRELIPVGAGESFRWNVHGWPSSLARWNYHPEYELHLVQRGSGRFIVGDNIGSYEPGQLVLVGSNLPHHWISDEPPGTTIPDRDVVLQFHPDVMQQWQQIIPEMSCISPLLKAAGRGLEFQGPAAREATRALRDMGGSRGLGRVQELLHILTVLTDGLDAARPLATPGVSLMRDAQAPDMVETVLHEIYVNLDADVRLGEIAQRVGMSPSALSRYFTRTTGQTLRDTIRRLRLVKACQLLDSTDKPITRVAMESGYRNLSNFNRQFRRETGTSPRTYRSRSRGDDPC